MFFNVHRGRVLLFAAMGLLGWLRDVYATCGVSSSSALSEKFSSTTYYDSSNSSVDGWSSSSGAVFLNGRGGEFSLAIGENYTGVISAMTGGDFNLDSRCLDDFVMVSRNPKGTCQLIFGRNKGGTKHEGFALDSTVLASLDTAICDRNAAPLLLTGTFNNDSFPDLIVANGYLSSNGETGDL